MPIWIFFISNSLNTVQKKQFPLFLIPIPQSLIFKSVSFCLTVCNLNLKNIVQSILSESFKLGFRFVCSKYMTAFRSPFCSGPSL